MPDPKPQLLLTGRPMVCTRCMHGHAVETITDRMNSPVEYHCGYCGNYAIVGVPAQFPFMVAVKDSGRAGAVTRMPIGQDSQSAKKVTALRDNRHSGSACDTVSTKAPDTVLPDVIAQSGSPSPGAQPDHDDNGTSPMQVGEKLRKQEEPMSTFKCKHPGCDKRGAVAGYCNNHFKERYGITAEQYRAEKRGRKEDPMVVAERVREYSLAASKARVDRASETFHAAMEEEKEKHSPETGIPATTKADHVALFQIFLDPELLEALTAAAKREYRTPELHAAYLISKAVGA